MNSFSPNTNVPYVRVKITVTCKYCERVTTKSVEPIDVATATPKYCNHCYSKDISVDIEE